MLLNGAQIVAQCLLEQGVNTIFGYPGNNVLGIYDALYEKRGKIKHILPTHEQYGIFAADGYARATGKTGVVIATSGPGATNLTTGIAASYMDSSPLVIITGNVALTSLGKDSFQEVDTVGITMPITKYNTIVKDVHTLADTLRRAFYIAQSGRKGPVLIDIPSDIAAAKCRFEVESVKPLKRLSVCESEAKAAAELINESKKPYIIAGGGVIASEARDELASFAQKINAPVSTTLMGIGGFDTASPQYCGLLGMMEAPESAAAMKNCDLIIAVGTRFADRVTDNGCGISKKAQVLHIDADAAEIGKNVSADLYICGDAKNALSLLAQSVEQKDDTFLSALSAYENTQPAHGKDEALAQKLLAFAGVQNNIVFTTDVGAHQLWAAKHLFVSTSRGFISSGGLGAMGFALPSAIGAAIGTGKRAVAVCGDGGFYMSMGELTTACLNQLPITVLLFNNRCLKMVRDIQVQSTHPYCVDFDRKADIKALCEALGARYFRADGDNYKESLTSALTGGVNVCEIIL